MLNVESLVLTLYSDPSGTHIFEDGVKREVEIDRKRERGGEKEKLIRRGREG